VGGEVLEEHGGELGGGQLGDPMADLVDDLETIGCVDVTTGELGAFACDGHVLGRPHKQRRDRDVGKPVVVKS
jgi:hypothetical protein